ncbi:MAG: hypothetical protein WCW87_01085 [Candidatus Paceibacterota bacterium]
MPDIKTIKYLKDEQYYRDLYDRFTVEECRRYERRFLHDELPKRVGKPKSKKGEKIARGLMSDLALYAIVGERFADKSTTIDQWMSRDKAKDERLERAHVPDGVSCIYCRSQMTCTSKDFHGPDDRRILFFFHCPACSKNRAIYDNGEEYQPAQHRCSKCSGTVRSSDVREGNKITTTHVCKMCGSTETEILDLDEELAEEKPDDSFAADRERFCLSQKAGLDYIGFRAKMTDMKNLLAKYKDQENQKELYDEVKTVKKIGISDLEKLLIPALADAGYVKLDFSKPDMNRGVAVEFTVQDATSATAETHEYDRRMILKKTIERVLFDTNWKLIGDSIMYRLGILNGRLRGLETETEIVEMVRARQAKEEKKVSKKKS